MTSGSLVPRLTAAPAGSTRRWTTPGTAATGLRHPKKPLVLQPQRLTETVFSDV